MGARRHTACAGNDLVTPVPISGLHRLVHAHFRSAADRVSGAAQAGCAGHVSALAGISSVCGDGGKLLAGTAVAVAGERV